MRKFLPSTLLLSLLLLLSFISEAKSFLLIQGDKATPIYVKVEGTMMPRYGMNYCIVPNLGEGLTTFEILFQGNKYPPQLFKIYIPENGSRSFVVAIDGNAVALYDFNSKLYLEANNKEDHTYMPPTVAITQPSYTVQDTDTDRKTTKPVRENNEKNDELVWGFSARKDTDETNTTQSTKDSTDRFLSNVDMDNTKNFKKNKAAEEERKRKEALEERRKINEAKLAQKKPENTDNAAPISDINTSSSATTNCQGGAMDNAVFENIALMVAERTTDEDKLKLIKTNAQANCFSMLQAKILASELNSPSARYEAVEQLFPRIEHTDNIDELVGLFTSKFLQKKVRELGKKP